MYIVENLEKQVIEENNYHPWSYPSNIIISKSLLYLSFKNVYKFKYLSIHMYKTNNRVFTVFCATALTSYECLPILYNLQKHDF